MRCRYRSGDKTVGHDDWRADVGRSGHSWRPRNIGHDTGRDTQTVNGGIPVLPTVNYALQVLPMINDVLMVLEVVSDVSQVSLIVNDGLRVL